MVSGSCLYTQDMLDSSNSVHDVMNTLINGDESLVFFTFSENATRTLNTTSLKCCLPLTDATDRGEQIHACV